MLHMKTFMYNPEERKLVNDIKNIIVINKKNIIGIYIVISGML